MAARDDLKVWANTLSIDPVTNTPQRFTIGDDLWEFGILRGVELTAQHYNQMLYLITEVLKNDTLNFDSVYPIGEVTSVTGNPANPSIIYGKGVWVPYLGGSVDLGGGITTYYWTRVS